MRRWPLAGRGCLLSAPVFMTMQGRRPVPGREMERHPRGLCYVRDVIRHTVGRLRSCFDAGDGWVSPRFFITRGLPYSYFPSSHFPWSQGNILQAIGLRRRGLSSIACWSRVPFRLLAMDNTQLAVRRLHRPPFYRPGRQPSESEGSMRRSQLLRKLPRASGSSRSVTSALSHQSCWQEALPPSLTTGGRVGRMLWRYDWPLPLASSLVMAKR